MLDLVIDWTDATPAAMIPRPEAPAAGLRDDGDQDADSGYGFGA